MTVAGTALGYLVWVLSGSFWLFLLSRIVTGAFSGNLSVATAAVADVTTRAERSKAMGIVGAAFGLGLVTGPTLGAFTAHINLLTSASLACPIRLQSFFCSRPDRFCDVPGESRVDLFAL